MKNLKPHKDEIRDFMQKHKINPSTAKHAMRLGFNHNVCLITVDSHNHKNLMKQWLDENDYQENVEYFYVPTRRFFFKDPELATMAKLAINT